jgi:serine O-acetyltransferase
MRLIKALRTFMATPLRIAYLLSDQGPLVDADVARWNAVLARSGGPMRGVAGLAAARREFRNVFYHRMIRGNRAGRIAATILRRIYREEATLFIVPSADIGPGLFIQHGFATIIAARRVGANAWINQQVTIGFSNETLESPVLGDNVTVSAGAKIIGGVHVGDGATVGANAVVIRDVPSGSLAVGVPAHQ